MRKSQNATKRVFERIEIATNLGIEEEKERKAKGNGKAKRKEAAVFEVNLS